MSQQQYNDSREIEEALLSVDSLDVEFAVDDGTIHALRDVSMTIQKGEMLGIAGESGSGKSTLALAILRYLDDNARIPNGSVIFKGRDLLELSKSELRSVRGKEIAHVAQNAGKALNPSMRIGEQIKESVVRYQDVSGKKEAMEGVYEVLEQVNIPDPKETANRYPNELSGGQQQRVLIAIALSCQPELMIMDEPTTGLDVTTQAKLLDLMEELKAEYNMGILLITHNLSVIAQVTDRVNILYAGEIMETGPIEDVFSEPANPYTQALLATTPELDRQKQLQQIPGQIPELDRIPEGCIFADRCEFATDECRTESIEMESVSSRHKTRCRRWEAAREDPILVLEAQRERSTPGEPILEISNLVKHYDPGTFFQNLLGDHNPVRAVRNVNLDIREGETVGLVGESGCGKSTLGRTVLGLHKPTDGTIKYRGTKLSELSGAKRKEFHKECQIIFQDPEASLNPRKTVKNIIGWPVTKFTGLEEEERTERIDELLHQVGLHPRLKSKYPYQLSGGQQQRVSIARAFAAEPALVVLDEPVSSLDVSVQASILNLLDELREKYNTSYLLISHDMGVIKSVSNRLAVMYLGEIIEIGDIGDVLEPPFHPYTRSLLTSIPSLVPGADKNRLTLEGDVPSARTPPSGCAFHTRCPQKIGKVCETETPALAEIEASESNCISCHLSREEMSKEITRD